MTHTRVKSSNLYSLAHDGQHMEVRFNCQACGGTGHGATTTLGITRSRVVGKCSNCRGEGHTGTYHGPVPESVYLQVRDAKSPGAAFNKLVRGNSAYKLTKQ